MSYLLVQLSLSEVIIRKSNEAFLHVFRIWESERVESPKLIFTVIEMDTNPKLADVFELKSYPSLVYLSEYHSISKVRLSILCFIQILPFESDSWVLEGNGGILSEERIIQFLRQCTGVNVVLAEPSPLDHLPAEQLFRYLFSSRFLGSGYRDWL